VPHDRRFAPRCSECRQKTMAIATVPYRIQVDHDGKKYDVQTTDLSVPKCANCGALSIDEVASDQIDEAFRREAKLLTRKEIREGRLNTEFPRAADFAKCLGIGTSTLSRWETGAQVQQRFHDGILRAFFKFPELRYFLAKLHGLTVPPQPITVYPVQPVQIISAEELANVTAWVTLLGEEVHHFNLLSSPSPYLAEPSVTMPAVKSRIQALVKKT
jgi:DNA-binding transcriptional regulator YiaG